MELAWEHAGDVKLKPTDHFVSLVQNIKKIPGSFMLDKVTPIVNHNNIIFFLCDLCLKKNKRLYVGVTVCFDWNVGDFNMVGDPEVGLAAIGSFGSKILALKTTSNSVSLIILHGKKHPFHFFPQIAFRTL